MRLIDAEAFERSVMFGDAEDMQDVIYALRDYPTTYDLDKVVAQLEYQKNIWNHDEVKDARLVDEKRKAFDMAIKIVKGGRVE